MRTAAAAAAASGAFVVIVLAACCCCSSSSSSAAAAAVAALLLPPPFDGEGRQLRCSSPGASAAAAGAAALSSPVQQRRRHQLLRAAADVGGGSSNTGEDWRIRSVAAGTTTAMNEGIPSRCRSSDGSSSGSSSSSPHSAGGGAEDTTTTARDEEIAAKSVTEATAIAFAVRRRLEAVLLRASEEDGNGGVDGSSSPDTGDETAGATALPGASSSSAAAAARRCFCYPISPELIRSLLALDDDDDVGDSPSQPPGEKEEEIDVAEAPHGGGGGGGCFGGGFEGRVWCDKPALDVLIRRLERWSSTWDERDEASPPPPRRHRESFRVPGVVEVLPNWCRGGSGGGRGGGEGGTGEEEGFVGRDGGEEVLGAFRALRSKLALAAEDSEGGGGGGGNEVDDAVDGLFRSLGKPGILYLLCHRSTVGSTDRLCPSLPRLLGAFEAPHVPCGDRAGRLTVGGRALTKHANRGGSFWPDVNRGNNDFKNELALGALRKILADAAWVNCHVVPLGVDHEQCPVVEIRQSRGYGARWSVAAAGAAEAAGGDNPADVVFRGFLEPVSPYYEGEEEGESGVC